MDDEATTGGRRPWQLATVCVLVLLEAATLVGLAAAFVADLVRGNTQAPGATIFMAAFALGIAALLVAAARALWAGRRWGRSPVMTWQVLLVVMSIGWLTSGASLALLAVLVVALGVGVGLVLPVVVAATTSRAAGAGAPTAG